MRKNTGGQKGEMSRTKESCPECGRYKTFNTGAGVICTNVLRCNLAISKEEDLAQVDKMRGAEWVELINTYHPCKS
jgi:hypothetical protein